MMVQRVVVVSSVSLLVLLALVVAIAFAVAGRAGSARRSPVRPYSLLLLGVALVSQITLVVSLGVATRALAELVGPSPILAVDYASPPVPLTTTGPAGSFAIGSRVDTATSLANDRHDRRNHDISLAVIAGFFALSASVGYEVAWRRAKSLDSNGHKESDSGAVPVGYVYLVAGLAALGVLFLAPLSAAALFRAIAPGVNGTSGHADGLRRLATFGVLLLISVKLLRDHFSYAATLRRATGGSEGISDDETPSD